MNVLVSLLDIGVALLVVAGAMFSLIGAWGLARLPDFFLRLHAPTKASTLGIGCTLLASIALTIPAGFPPHELLITLFIFVTAPVAAHLLARAAIALDARAGSADVPATPLESRARKSDSRDVT